MVRVPDHYIEGLKDEIVTLRAMLEPMEAGKLYIGDRDLGSVAPEATRSWIEHLKRTIAMYQSIVDSKDA